MKKIVALIILILGLAFAIYLFKTKTLYKNESSQNNPSISATSVIQSPQKTGPSPNFNLTIPQGFKIGVFSSQTPDARDLQFSPEGTLLASETSEGRVVALPDKNQDGVVDSVITLISNLNNPHGLAFYNGKLFVAQELEVDRYNFDEENLTATFDKKLFNLPNGGRHFTRSLVFDKKGNLYVSIGSTCDTCVEKNSEISTVLVSNSDGKTPKIFSKGLRNAVFLALNPATDKVWVTEMGRDYLGNTTPPDEIDILQKNGNYGWPYCYGDKQKDTTMKAPSSNYCQTTIAPFFKIQAHSAPLGLTFINSSQFPQDEQGDLLVAYHGSMDKSITAGYKVSLIKLNGIPQEEDFVTGFLSNGKVLGRPVDVTFDKAGSLFISDDRNGAIYKVVRK
jgi:glucose/arabinose dehydrogenase